LAKKFIYCLNIIIRPTCCLCMLYIHCYQFWSKGCRHFLKWPLCRQTKCCGILSPSNLWKMNIQPIDLVISGRSDMSKIWRWKKKQYVEFIRISASELSLDTINYCGGKRVLPWPPQVPSPWSRPPPPLASYVIKPTESASNYATMTKIEVIITTIIVS